MAKTLFELAQEYLNQGMPDISQASRTTSSGTTSSGTTSSGTTSSGTTTDPNAPQKVMQLGLPIGGGDGYNSTRTQSNYSPYASRQASERSYVGDPNGYRTNTEAQKMMDNYPDYYEGKQLTGIPGAIANYAKSSFLGKGLDYLGSKMPVNSRAIMENEMLGQGFALDDIGRIARGSGAYDTAANVMSGYNANQLTAESFDKRIAMAEKNMSDKNKGARITALKEAKAAWEKATGKSTSIFDPNNTMKNSSVFRFKKCIF